MINTLNKQKVILWLGIIFMILFCLAPMLWQVLTSFKTNEAIIKIPTVYFPNLEQLTLEHYFDLGFVFLRYMFNSAFVSLISTILCVVIGDLPLML